MRINLAHYPGLSDILKPKVGFKRSDKAALLNWWNLKTLNRKNISIAIPAYREEGSIFRSLSNVVNNWIIPDEITKTIVVVVNGPEKVTAKTWG